MTLDLTFKQVCELVSKDGREDPKLLEAVDKLLGLAMICSPLILGPAAAALLPTLAVKNELVKIGKGVFDKLTKKKDDDYVARQERMQMAYGLLVFTAFFDALDGKIPKSLRERFKLFDGEKVFLAKDAAGRTAGHPKEPTDACERADAPLAAMALPFPHPTESLDQQVERHANLWKQMAQGFHEFIQKLAFWKEADEKEQAQTLAAIQKVPEEAAKRFEAQYFPACPQIRRFRCLGKSSGTQENQGTHWQTLGVCEAARQAFQRWTDFNRHRLRKTARHGPRDPRDAQD